MVLRIHYEGRMHPGASCEALRDTILRFAAENDLLNPIALEAHIEPTEELLALMQDALNEHALHGPPSPENLQGPYDEGDQHEQMMMMGMLIDGSIFQVNISRGALLQDNYPRDPVSIATHIMVVDLLRQIEPYFSEFRVLDEGGYWATRDIIELQRRRDAVEQLVESYRNIERARTRGG